MKFTPLSEEELNTQKISLDPGPANFMVMDAEEKKSRNSGNQMIELRLRVWDQNGKEGILYDYLLGEKALWKLRDFLNSIGRPEVYQTGDINCDLILGASGKCKLGIQNDPKFGDRIRIKSYDAKEKVSEYIDQEIPAKEEFSESFGEDDILF